MRRILVAVAVLGSLTACGTTATTPTPTDLFTIPSDTTAYSTMDPSVNDVPSTVPTGPTLTDAQQNAVSTAQQYLDMGSGFSRLGLIQQLSSSAGSGYALSDARVAVDSLNEDWNAQAVLAAQGYKALQAWSCSGLIRQLDSSAGAQFTYAQASYGSKKAGVC